MRSHVTDEIAGDELICTDPNADRSCKCKSRDRWREASGNLWDQASWNCDSLEIHHDSGRVQQSMQSRVSDSDIRKARDSDR